MFSCFLVLNICTQLSAQRADTRGKRTDSYKERHEKEKGKKEIRTSELSWHIT